MFLNMIRDFVTDKLIAVLISWAEFVVVFCQCKWEFDWFDRNFILITLFKNVDRSSVFNTKI